MGIPPNFDLASCHFWFVIGTPDIVVKCLIIPIRRECLATSHDQQRVCFWKTFQPYILASFLTSVCIFLGSQLNWDLCLLCFCARGLVFFWHPICIALINGHCFIMAILFLILCGRESWSNHLVQDSTNRYGMVAPSSFTSVTLFLGRQLIYIWVCWDFR